MPRIAEVFPYLRVRQGEGPRAIAFYVAAFGAVERFRLVEPAGRVGHAELQLGPHVLMVSEEYPEYGILAPDPTGATRMVGASVHLHVDDADAMIAQALAAGAVLVRAATDEFYGERSGKVRDPFGHEWLIGHQLEEVTPAEMQRRFTALFIGG
jgi:uncharacterized glyoxalase superfamily protein PhnB